jgi:hypothetical protein
MDWMIKPEGKTAIVLATALLVGCTVGGIGFVLGRDSAEPAQAQSVTRAANTEAVAKARKAGYRNGFADGRKAAQRQAADGRTRDDRATGHDALAVDDFSLDPGYYVVRVGGDARAIDYAPMESGLSYELCDAYGVCRGAR